MKKEIKDNEVVNVVNCFEERISKIRSIVYHYELLDVIPDFNKKNSKEKKQIIEYTINFYLSKIKKMNNYNLIKDNNYDIDEILDFFSYSNKQDNKNKYYVVEDSADYIVDDLLNKLFRNDNRKLNLPVHYDIINEYGLSSEIDEKDTTRAFLWIILKLSVIYSFLKDGNK